MTRKRIITAIVLIAVGWGLSALGTPGDDWRILIALGLGAAYAGAACGLSGLDSWHRWHWRAKLIAPFGIAMIGPVVADTILR